MALTMSMRQPFATLNMDSPRLQSLSKSKFNIKNQRNDLTCLSKSQISGPDAENIDPAGLKMPTKRKRASDGEPLKESPKAAKVNRAILTPRTALGGKRLDSPTIPSTPKSAPVAAHKPAGRSPRIKSSKPFARRSIISKNRTEPAQLSRNGVHRPFSLAMALANGKPTSRSSQLESQPGKSASWFFEIHEDTNEDEMTNLMQHSTCVLDINNDEDNKRNIGGRGKENIPPCGTEVIAARAVGEPCKQKLDEKEDRAPLNELIAAKYYGKGCHAFSYVVVQDEEGNLDISEKASGDIPGSREDSPVGSKIISDTVASEEAADNSEVPEVTFVVWESESCDGHDD